MTPTPAANTITTQDISRGITRYTRLGPRRYLLNESTIGALVSTRMEGMEFGPRLTCPPKTGPSGMLVLGDDLSLWERRIVP